MLEQLTMRHAGPFPFHEKEKRLDARRIIRTKRGKPAWNGDSSYRPGAGHCG